MAVNPARFRKTGNRVELEGTVSAGGSGNGGTDRTAVFTMPEG
jgi:hypothetical protein